MSAPTQPPHGGSVTTSTPTAPVPVPSITAEQTAALAEPLMPAGPLNPQTWSTRELYGGAITICLPNRFIDCSKVRQIPDHQEVWADGDTDQSIIIELNSREEDVTDQQAATHYMNELAEANDALSHEILQSGSLSAQEMPGFDASVPKSYIISAQRVSKYRESAQQSNLIQIYLAVVRLQNVGTDLLISFNVPLAFGAGSSSEGKTIMDAVENKAVIEGVCRTIKVVDWSLFG